MIDRDYAPPPPPPGECCVPEHVHRRGLHDPLFLQISPAILDDFAAAFGTPGMKLLLEVLPSGLLVGLVERQPWSFVRRLRFLLTGR